jgi:hypothetical protein
MGLSILGIIKQCIYKRASQSASLMELWLVYGQRTKAIDASSQTTFKQFYNALKWKTAVMHWKLQWDHAQLHVFPSA